LKSSTWAEYVALPEDEFVARKPAGASFAEAGAAPLAGGTALCTLEALQLATGDTVLVVGATGGVGCSSSSSRRPVAPT
jgi:NADPH:quinone reductase-like Zn-dependent oxidoreductase